MRSPFGKPGPLWPNMPKPSGVATNLTVTGPGRNGLTLLELGDTFVVAERFSIVET